MKSRRVNAPVEDAEENDEGEGEDEGEDFYPNDQDQDK